MKNKYMINGGIAFTEKKDLKKLEQHAVNGWLLEKFAFGGLCYKLVKGPSQKLTYSLDLQADPEAEYLDIFEAAGWHHVTTYHKEIHIFSAVEGTNPIYSENELSENKYETITKSLGKGATLTFIAVVIFSLSMLVSRQYFDLLERPFFVLSLLSIIMFIFCFMPYMMFIIKGKIKR